jgi:DNA polymerase III epsilon subunit-like protein
MLKEFWPVPLVIIDLETTDSNGKTGDIIEIGAVVMTKEAIIKTESFHSYVKPLSDFRNPEAMAVNKIDESILKTAPDLTTVLGQFEEWAFRLIPDKKSLLASWGGYFDIPFIREQYGKIDKACPFKHMSVCIKAVCYSLTQLNRGDPKALWFKGVEKIKKENNLSFFGQKHSALDDVMNEAQLLQYLLFHTHHKLTTLDDDLGLPEDIFESKYDKCPKCGNAEMEHITTNSNEDYGGRTTVTTHCDICSEDWLIYDDNSPEGYKETLLAMEP